LEERIGENLIIWFGSSVSSKGLYGKGLVTKYREVVEYFMRWGLMKESYIIEGVPLKGIVGLPSLLFCFLTIIR
jgi:hypothetical protein